jgi:hypothetical protein
MPDNSMQPVYVTLRVSVDEAQRRVSGDPSRRLSKIPQVLRGCYADFAAVPPIPSDVTIDSTAIGVEDAISILSATLDAAANQSVNAGSNVQALFTTSTVCRSPCLTWRAGSPSIVTRLATHCCGARTPRLACSCQTHAPKLKRIYPSRRQTRQRGAVFGRRYAPFCVRFAAACSTCISRSARSNGF